MSQSTSSTSSSHPGSSTSSSPVGESQPARSQASQPHVAWTEDQSVEPNGDLELSAAGNGEFSLSEARRIVGDFFHPNPWIYWSDFLVSWAVGIAAYSLVRYPERITANEAWHWPLSIVLFFTSALLIYRCSLFIHELVHIRTGEFKVFRIVWNLLAGVPFLIPTFVYYTHIDHHRRKHYGTQEDGEYISLARMPPGQILFYLSQVLVIPLLAIARWGLLTPLSWISPKVRDWTHKHASSMIMDPMYVRPLPTPRVRRMIRLQEALCFLFVWFIGIRMFTGFGVLSSEPLPFGFLVQAYLTGVFVVSVNALRTLGAHRWTSDGTEMSFVDQMLDSINYPGRPFIGGLWAPIGLRFHALHHIFPTMPYHALAEAHRKLMSELPEDSPYRRTNAQSLWAELALLWRRSRESRHAAS
ncbi:MAG: fatty acid desaturase [Planctomycetales bacterium]|nr:fatty acid desaturase [Planctomycetales bacterium]